ncbi:hypothetical protein [Rhodoblastus sp.]|uniref:hypothetical protein n=1 Tax=Rhodoblastus sp. TaxID=1962975 RepID=UPI002606A32C|nr:hypothetical protein [Rhodoblastus sp.]
MNGLGDRAKRPGSRVQAQGGNGVPGDRAPQPPVRTLGGKPAGLAGEAAEAGAMGVVAADFEAPGDEDIAA